ncbi:hypothetical protein [Parvicella tangerina]|uniref:Lipoprotein n=1 Tax=Parvicella tangerina TaxID=2829795 RepID=A0A916NGC0_9FLAO|nr:hypothetical protein [Parvicella tangerina]CAG5079496.1 hypothetical protein CRYO30217_00959 [Parvicella tangerina]
MNTKNITKIGLAALVAASVSMTSCKKGCTDETAENYNEKAKKDDGSCTYAEPEETNEVVSGSITSNTTWTNDKIYELDGKVVVDNGATLTIEPGTIIKGQEGTGTNASALIIARGAKINAVGTASSPIIFTSVLDNIEIGQTVGTNLDETDNGKWGGVIILGYAPISAGDGDTESQIEGIPATDSYGTFGGSNAADNSGTMSYVSIRHGGALIGAGNEINGLTLGGVGTGTTLSNIEVVANLDDGIEFFGGTVDVDNLLIAFQGDDGVDIDMNYAGTVNNFAVIHGIDTDEGLEIDGPEGSTHTTGMFTLSNGSIWTTDGTGTGADLKSKAQGTISNVYWQGYTSKMVKVRASFTDTVACTDKSDAYTHLTSGTPTLTISNSEFVSSSLTISDVVDVYNGSVELSSNDVCTSSYEATAESAVTTAGSSVVSAATTGATMSSFSWTWASAKGKI